MSLSRKTPFIRKVKRFWSIPIVRIATGLLLVLLIVLIFFGIFKGCGDGRDVSDESTAEQSGSVSEISDAQNSVPVPEPWTYSDVGSITTEISSEYGIVINATTRQVVAAKNHNQTIYPASMTRIMTLIVAVQSGVDLNETYTLSEELIKKYYDLGAVITNIHAGDAVSIKDLLYGVVLESASDAAAAIAETVAGSETEFVKLMNDKAKEIGCQNTKFSNVNGFYSTENYSTVGDVALMLDYAMSIPQCMEILSTETYYTGATSQNDNGYKFTSSLFSRINTNIVEGLTLSGGITGYMSQTRHSLACMALGSNGEKYIVVTAVGQYWQNAIEDCVYLFENYYVTE